MVFLFSSFSIYPQGGTLLLQLLNMYVNYWSWGSHYISVEWQTVDNGDTSPLLPLSGAVCPLMYLPAQLVQITSSITGLIYENVDTYIGAQ